MGTTPMKIVTSSSLFRNNFQSHIHEHLVILSSKETDYTPYPRQVPLKGLNMVQVLMTQMMFICFPHWINIVTWPL